MKKDMEKNINKDIEKEDIKKISATIIILKRLENAIDYLNINDLRSSMDVSENYVRSIIKKLKDKKLVGSSKGNKGGYFLTETIKDMKYSEIMELALGE